jgi:hypothetical protein
MDTDTKAEGETRGTGMGTTEEEGGLDNRGLKNIKVMKLISLCNYTIIK